MSVSPEETDRAASPERAVSGSERDAVWSRLGWSAKRDPAEALDEIFDGVDAGSAGVAFVFVSPSFDLDSVSRAIRRTFPCPVLACTTAGELASAEGHVSGGVAAAALFGVEAGFATMSGVSACTPADAAEAVRRLGVAGSELSSERSVALLVVDGLTRSEERVASHLHHALDGVPLVGGSAGDDCRFERTLVFDGERFVEDGAAVVLIRSPGSVAPFAHQHFDATESKLVITAADPRERVVREINGAPAALAYADALGVPATSLTGSFLSSHPMMILTRSGHFVRSIQRIGPDGSMRLYCSIDEGLVITVGAAKSIEESLGTLVADKRLEDAALVLGFDCILRRTEAAGAGMTRRLAERLSGRPIVGFSTYGEQYLGLHVNQTLTGVVFKKAA